MENFNRKMHWERIFQTKNFNEVSWYQAIPEISLRFFERFHLPKTAKIIDIGSGDSLLVDKLLELGYKNLTLLDISEKALERARQRLGENASKVTWIAADISQFHPSEQYDFWHDRAAFHFLTDEGEIHRYLETVNRFIKPDGYLVLGTFSENGPEKCSGLPVQRYTEMSMAERLKCIFRKIRCVTVDHLTPSGAVQEFLFCCFKRRQTIQ